MTQTLPVRQWYVRLERVRDEQAAIEGWHALIRAQGWSPVGDPEVIHDGATPAVVGRLVQYPGLAISPNVRDAVVVP